VDSDRRAGEETLGRHRAIYGETHSYTLAARTNFAIGLRLRNHPASAQKMNEKTYELLREKLRREQEADRLRRDTMEGSAGRCGNNTRQRSTPLKSLRGLRRGRRTPSDHVLVVMRSRV
jgi:hypothetical protein